MGAARREPSKTARRPRLAGRPPGEGRADLALQIARLAGEMVELARLGEFRTLAYLADMARMEAEEQARLLRRRTGRVPPSAG